VLRLGKLYCHGWLWWGAELRKVTRMRERRAELLRLAPYECHWWRRRRGRYGWNLREEPQVLVPAVANSTSLAPMAEMGII